MGDEANRLMLLSSAIWDYLEQYLDDEHLERGHAIVIDRVIEVSESGNE